MFQVQVGGLRGMMKQLICDRVQRDETGAWRRKHESANPANPQKLQ
jgi:hypothetical protein